MEATAGRTRSVAHLGSLHRFRASARRIPLTTLSPRPPPRPPRTAGCRPLWARKGRTAASRGLNRARWAPASGTCPATRSVVGHPRAPARPPQGRGRPGRPPQPPPRPLSPPRRRCVGGVGARGVGRGTGRGVTLKLRFCLLFRNRPSRRALRRMAPRPLLLRHQLLLSEAQQSSLERLTSAVSSIAGRRRVCLVSLVAGSISQTPRCWCARLCSAPLVPATRISPAITRGCTPPTTTTSTCAHPPPPHPSAVCCRADGRCCRAQGPFFFRGQYHLFMQQSFPWVKGWNGAIGWGHLVSSDLVRSPPPTHKGGIGRLARTGLPAGMPGRAAGGAAAAGVVPLSSQHAAPG